MYWTLDTRPPTLDERIIQAKARHAERVEQIAAEEPVPQLEVPEVYTSKADHVAGLIRDLNRDDILDAMIKRLLMPGEFFEVPGSKDVRDLYREIAEQRLSAQQNAAFSGLGGFAGQADQRNVFGGLAGQADQRNVFGDRLAAYPHPAMSEAQHTLQITKDGGRWLSSRGPFYHPPTTFGTLTEFV